MAESDRHAANENVLIVGKTAKARKGTSWGHIERVMKIADPEFVEDRILSGFGSGEALVDAVTPPSEDDPNHRYDHRVLVREGEFARLLEVTRREGGILSTTIRDAWDGRPLATRARIRTAIAKSAHISINGHITMDELGYKTNAVDRTNGFLNRFLVVLAKRSQNLPFGGRIDDAVIASLGRELGEAFEAARKIGRVNFTSRARDLWAEYYDELSMDEPPDPLGSMVARAEAHTLRLALVYALLDGSHFIDVPHLEAAIACWHYSRASCAFLWGSPTSNAIADKIVKYLASRRGEWVGKSALHNKALKNNESADNMNHALNLLEARGVIEGRIFRETGGAPAGQFRLRGDYETTKEGRGADHLPSAEAPSFVVPPLAEAQSSPEVESSFVVSFASDEFREVEHVADPAVTAPVTEPTGIHEAPAGETEESSLKPGDVLLHLARLRARGA